MNKKYIAAFVLSLILFVSHIFAQGLSPTVASVSMDGSGEKEGVGGSIQMVADPQLAMSVPDYPVTSGDVYTLVFAAGSTPVTYTIPVDLTYKIRVANLGVLNGRGLTYNQLKAQVEALVTKNYPMSGVQFVLTSPAVFLVSISGEVGHATERKAWALTRLSSFVSSSLTSYSSTRNVTVISSDGKKKEYDLFKARRDGDFSQDPYLRPGDKIVINRYDRKVSIAGAVERPGTYEIMKDENLKTLIGLYGNGLTEYADTSRIVLRRVNNSSDQAGDTVYLDKSVILDDFVLENADSITISSRIELRDTMFFEGAVGALGRESQNNNSDSSDSNNVNNPIINRIPVQFLAGENYATLVRRNGGQFFPTSDLRNAYIIRKGQKIPLNLEDVLYNKDYMSEYIAQQNDTLYVPYLQTTSTVLITGEVTATAEVDAWPLKRLSTLIHDRLTAYSSTRSVEVVAIDGSVTSYDLFYANRSGDMSQNPYIRPGEIITVKRMERKVTIGGAVERPGTYELLAGENLKTLIEKYGNGLTEYADTTRIVLRRINNSSDVAGDTIYLAADVVTKDYALENADSITIPSRTELRDTLFFEGAVGALGRESQNNNSDSSDSNNVNNPIINRIPVQFLAGENYATLVRRNGGQFFPTSDLRNAYIIRKGQKIPLNLEDVLYNKDYMSEYIAQQNDTLYVPYLQTTSTVLITGEVTATAEVDAWPLKRLSTLIHDRLTAYSSTRSVEVVAIDGSVTSYDLFYANRSGDMSQNPYIRPGEIITVKRMERKVTIGGAVERPGTYELLAGENLKTLIEKYGNGLTEYADTSRIVLSRINNSSDQAGDTIYLASDVVTKDYTLENADSITIPSRIELRDTLFFEGAVGALGRESQNNTADNGINNVANPIINRIPVQFLSGENYATLIRRNSGAFFPTSDLRNAYIIRKGLKISLNLEDVLYNKDYMSDYIAQQNDTLYVPYMQTTSTVLIMGEVTATAEVDAWPLKRLSSLIGDRLTAYSSTRNVMVTSIDGTVTTYDLFLSTRFGDMEQNPYIRPGEIITVNRIDRKVSITGAVERPGTYELLKGENLRDLVEYYGNGLAPLADVSRIELYRPITGEEGSGEKFYLNKASLDENYELICYDSVMVSSYNDLLPTIFVEGAVNASEGTTLEASNRIAASFNNGEDYAYFVRRNKKWFSAVSDVKNAYIIRGDQHIPIDLSLMLYDASYYSNTPMQKDDILMIPFRQYFVTVSGAVKNPGRFPYIPDRNWDYYIGLAGGFDKTKNKLDSITITDMHSEKQSKKDFIGPEYTIEAKTNAFSYYFNQYAPIITTALSILATSLSAYAVIKSMN